MTHTTIALMTPDGSCPAHVFRPSGVGPFPGVLFFMDGIGIRPAMFEIGERFAKEGVYALLPDLFYRAGAYTAPDPKQLFADPAVRGEWFKKVGQAGQPANIIRDTPVFLEHLAGAKDVLQPKIGATGYCMGGRIAITAAGMFPERFAFAAAFHPGGVVNDAPDSPHLVASKAQAKLFVAAASEDTSFPEEHKQKLGEALTSGGVSHTIETWPARHGFVPSDTPVHDKACADRHWTKLLELVGQLRA
jgi:carboxymethylenebutenolidase